MEVFRTALIGVCLFGFSLTAIAQHEHPDRQPKPQKQAPDGEQAENDLLNSQKNSGMLAGTGPYEGPGGFDRGMQTTMYCGNSPESWVRGSAFLDKSDGSITIHMDLETDSTTAGPRGRIKVTVIDGSGNSLASATTDEAGIGGKAPGKFRLVKISGSASVPPEVAGQAASMRVEAECTGSQGGLFGIPLDKAVDAIKVLVQLAGAVARLELKSADPVLALRDRLPFIATNASRRETVLGGAAPEPPRFIAFVSMLALRTGRV